MVQLIEQDVKTKEVLSWKGIHLIHFQGSSCSQKTRIFLNLKSIEWTSHPLNLVKQENYEPWFLGINPRGLVPVLVHDGIVHIESNDILEHLDEKFPKPCLIPNDIRKEIVASLKEEDNLHLDLRALTMRFVLPKFLAQKKPESLALYEENLGTVDGAKDSHKDVELKFWQDYAVQGITDEQVQTSARKFYKAYEGLEQRLVSQPYLCGSSITLVDIAWFIYTFRLTQAGYPFGDLHPSVMSWYEHLLLKPKFAKEVATPWPLRFVTATLHLTQRVTGQTMRRLAFKHNS